MRIKKGHLIWISALLLALFLMPFISADFPFRTTGADIGNFFVKLGQSILFGASYFFGTLQYEIPVQIFAIWLGIYFVIELTVIIRDYSFFSGGVSCIIASAITAILSIFGLIKILAILLYKVLSIFFGNLLAVIIGFLILVLLAFVISAIQSYIAGNVNLGRRKIRKAKEEIGRKTVEKIGEEMGDKT